MGALRDQWNGYADRPPMARWIARASMIIGGCGASTLMLFVAGVALVWAARALAWIWSVTF